MQGVGIVLTAIGIACTLWSAALLVRVKPERFERRASTFGDFGGGKVVGEYVRLTIWPVRLLIAAAVLQLVGLILVAVS
jgi:hypothetical protein